MIVVTGDNRHIVTGFFPASGNRDGSSLNNRGTNGNYWSSTFNNATNAYNLNFNSGNVNPANNNNRRNGNTVRPVQHSSKRALDMMTTQDESTKILRIWKDIRSRDSNCSSTYM